jgi:hypothetical protein
MKTKNGFIVNGIFYEDGSPEQEALLKSPITKEEEGTLLGYFKEICQKGI